MRERLNRVLNSADLVLCYPGSSYLVNAIYGIVIAENKVFTREKRVITCNACLAIGSLTEEQEKIKDELLNLYRMYSQERVQKGVRNIVPEIGGIYASSSAQYYFIYIGRYTLNLTLEKKTCSIWRDEYEDGVYTYIKVRYNSYDDNKIRKYLEAGHISSLEFSEFMSDSIIHNWLVSCSYNYRYKRKLPDMSYQLVFSTRKRTFVKELGKLDLSFLKRDLLCWTLNDKIDVEFRMTLVK